MSSVLDHPSHPCVSNAGGSCEAYDVEIRLARESSIVRRIGEQVVTTSWTSLELERRPLGSGVPNGHGTQALFLEASELMDYTTAQALRWWAVAQAKAHCFDLETRLVRYELNWSWNKKPLDAVKEVLQHELVWPNGEPDRTNP